MALNETTDTDTIARHIAYFGDKISPLGTGSIYNPEARTNNCFYVSLAYLLGMTAPDLSRKIGTAQGGVGWPEIAWLMKRSKELKLVSYFRLLQGLSLVDPFLRSKEDMTALPSSLVIYSTRAGLFHCVVGRLGPGGPEMLDFQHNMGRLVNEEVFPNGLTGKNSVVYTIRVYK